MLFLGPTLREKVECQWWGVGGSQVRCKINEKKEHLRNTFSLLEKLVAVSLSHFRGFEGLRSENSWVFKP